MTQEDIEANSVHLTIVATGDNTVGARIAKAVQLGHGFLRLHIEQPNGNVIHLHVSDVDCLNDVKYPLTRTQ